MIKLETIRDLFLIVVALLFLPYESRLILFDTKPEDWYGEIRISSGKEVIILAKNSGEKKVVFEVPVVRRQLFQHFDQEEAQELKEAGVLPFSYSVLLGQADKAQMTNRKVSIDGERLFSPAPLGVATRADYHIGFVLIAVVVGAFSVLAFVIATYICEHSGAGAGKSPVQAEP